MLYVDPDNLERKFGGKLPDKEADFWPPSVPEAEEEIEPKSFSKLKQIKRGSENEVQTPCVEFH